MSPSPESKTLFQSAENGTDPFPYFVSGKAFEVDEANALLDWLEKDAPWSQHHGAFFDQWECDVLAVSVPAPLRWLQAEETRSRLVARASDLFAADLDDRWAVTAHKLLPGQGIGVHNDAPSGNLETHRIVVHLAHDFNDDQGGHLLFLRSSSPDDIERIFRPLHNTAVGFAASDVSYHAVSTVNRGSRYSVVFSFWSTDTKGIEAESDPHRLAPAAELMAMGVGPATIFGAIQDHQVNHSGSTLAHHLLGTWRLLRAWGASPEIATAGLLHSVYSTHGFPIAMISVEQRPELEELVGPAAERLIYLFGATTRSDCVTALRDTEGSARLRSRFSGEGVDVSRPELEALTLVHMANDIEQLSRIDLDVREAHAGLSEFKELSDLWPPRAMNTLNQILRSLEST